jgi:hypothetical protein
MASVGQAPADGPPPIPPRAPQVVAPPLQFPAAAGTLTGWLVDQSILVTLVSLVTSIQAGFTRLSQNIPVPAADPGYAGAMRTELMDEVVNSTDLCCYLTVSEMGGAALRVT